jgi:hypothetical protein
LGRFDRGFEAADLGDEFAPFAAPGGFAFGALPEALIQFSLLPSALLAAIVELSRLLREPRRQFAATRFEFVESHVELCRCFGQFRALLCETGFEVLVRLADRVVDFAHVALDFVRFRFAAQPLVELFGGQSSFQRLAMPEADFLFELIEGGGAAAQMLAASGKLLAFDLQLGFVLLLPPGDGGVLDARSIEDLLSLGGHGAALVLGFFVLFP